MKNKVVWTNESRKRKKEHVKGSEIEKKIQNKIFLMKMLDQFDFGIG